MCQGNLHVIGTDIVPVILQALHRCDGIPVYSDHLALIRAAVPHQHNQYITLAAAVIFPDLCNLAQIINTGKKICFQITFGYIGFTLKDDLTFLFLLNGLLQRPPVGCSKDPGNHADACCQYHHSKKQLLIYFLCF